MKKLLLIEDQDDLRENTEEILQLASYQVFSAKDGKQGVELAIKEKPDLILCDIMMPVLDGYGVLNMIQNIPELVHVPFIFLSAKSDRTDLRKGMDLGADDYITKPFNGTELLSAIDRRLKKYDSLISDLSGSVEKIQLLNNINRLNHKDIIGEIIKNRYVNKYRKKQIIYSEGNRPSRLYYILSGKIRVIKTNDDAKELVVGLYKEGDFLGHIPLLENSAYKDTAEALEDAQLVLIPREEFDELMKKDINLITNFIQILAKDISTQHEHLISLAYNSLRKKVAQALISLYRAYKTSDDDYYIDMPREGLASIAGTATESLIRTLTDFKNEKLIEIKDSKIKILQEGKLDKLLN
ncbi:MAG: response regulator [Saprospiraceae bacterium]